MAALWFLYYKGYQTGVAHEREVRDHMIMLAQITATNVTNDLQRRANDAQARATKAAGDLDSYRRAHPVSVRICPAPGGHLPGGAGAGVAGTVQPDGVQPETARDIGPALDALAGDADTLNERYRVCRDAYQALVAP